MAGSAAGVISSVVPEIGQLVEVRRRQWVVSDVSRSALPPNPHDPDPPPPHHLLTLTSVEDDALGEELVAVWEIEPGARVLERAGLPEVEGFDDPERLRAFLHAVRWGAVTDADFDALQSPFRSGITIEDYQLDPLVRALRMPRANLLIADDVGLGKTIEAGLVIQELLLRHRARSVLIVCPASLQIKWRDEMAEKFGLEFRIVDTDLLRQLRRTRGIHTNPWTHFPRLITSVDWLKRDMPMRWFRDSVGRRGGWRRDFDILVVDEAHNVAPTGSSNYAVDSQRTQAIREIAPHFEHRLFLTATPHNGYQESFSSLLELLDDQRFARGIPPDPEQLATVMVRRLKDDIVDWNGEPKFAKRSILPIEVEYSDDEREAHRLLAEYTRLRQEASERGEGHHLATHFVLKLLKKRLFSSPAAFRLTLEKHLGTLQKDEDTASQKASVGILRRAIEQVDEEYADDEDREAAEGDAVGVASTAFDSLSDREREILADLAKWASKAEGRPDSKAEALLAWIDEHLRPDGEWSDQRVIVFTEYRATQNWLLGIFAAAGLTEGDRLMTMYGGMDTDERERIKAAFQAHPDDSPVRILLATDSASEGIDLQNHCSLMVHAEIPWNPNRLEQRNGRIDRHGQRAKEVRIHHFVGTGWEERADSVGTSGDLSGDLEFLYRAALKVGRIREDLGRVGPVIADKVERAMLGLGGDLDTSAVDAQAAAARQQLSIERDIRERIERLHDRLLESRHRLEIEPENVERVVRTALDIADQPALAPVEVKGVDAPVFEMPHFQGSWLRCTEGLEHPHTGKRRPITFDHSAIDGRDDLVLVHLEHRLSQMSLRTLRSEIWAPDGKLHRVTAEIVPDSVLDTPGVIVHARLVVIGQRQHRLHEEIVTAGGVIRAGRFRRFDTREQLDRVIHESKPDLPSSDMLDQLVSLWPGIEQSVRDSVTARVRDRMENLGNTLQRRRDREIEDMEQILRDLESTIRSQLEDPKQMALFQAAESSWTAVEQAQLKRNLGSLEARIEAIPEEIERERAAIEARYLDPQERVFPVAITFVVPESMRGG